MSCWGLLDGNAELAAEYTTPLKRVFGLAAPYGMQAEGDAERAPSTGIITHQTHRPRTALVSRAPRGTHPPSTSAGEPLSKAAERRLRKRKSQQVAAEQRAAESPAPTHANPTRQARHEQAEARHLEASFMVRSRYRLPNTCPSRHERCHLPLPESNRPAVKTLTGERSVSHPLSCIRFADRERSPGVYRQ